MRSRHYTLTSRQVHRYAEDLLQRHLHLKDHGPKCTASALYAILFWAASRLTSLAAACRALTKAPSDQAARNALRATLPQDARLLQQLNRALRGGLPRPLLRKKQKIALDLNLQPYYGKPLADPKELYKGKKKAGTRTFHAYATAYVIFKGCRWTLALRDVHHSDPWDAIVRDLMRQVQRAGVKVECVLLDRGFYCVDVIRYLQRARYPFVMPAIRRGLKPSKPGARRARGPSPSGSAAAGPTTACATRHSSGPGCGWRSAGCGAGPTARVAGGCRCGCTRRGGCGRRRRWSGCVRRTGSDSGSSRATGSCARR